MLQEKGAEKDPLNITKSRRAQLQTCLMQVKMTLAGSSKMGPHCSTDSWMPMHKSLQSQGPQHQHEAEQPMLMTLGKSSESGQKRWFQKQLCFNPLYPAVRTTTQ